MVSVAKHMPTFQYDPNIGSFKAWLLNMTRWRITDHIRKRNKHPTEGATGEDAEDETKAIERLPDPLSQNLDELWNAEWEKNLLEAAITKVKRRLDPLKSQIFDFYVNKGWPPGKVAETFGVPVDQVYLIKHRVTDLVKDEVKRLEKEMQ